MGHHELNANDLEVGALDGLRDQLMVRTLKSGSLLDRLRTAKSKKPPHDTSHLDDPDLMDRIAARGQASFDEFMATHVGGDVPVRAEPVNVPVTVNPDALTLTMAQAAERLGVTGDQVRAFIADGSLRWVNLGRGEKRPRYHIKPTDLDDFIAARTTQEASLCPSTRTRRSTKASTSSTSKSKVIGFTARRDALLAARQKSTKP